MKVLMISEYYPPFSKGGGELSAHALAKELAASGVSMHVLTSHFPGLDKEEVQEKVHVHRYLKTGQSPSSMMGNIERALHFEKSLLRQEKFLSGFDIIHCMNTTSMPAVRLKKKIDRHFILHVNGPTLFCPKATLMYKDREICKVQCNTYNFIDCWMNSNALGKVELDLAKKLNPLVILFARIRYLRYRGILSKFDHYFPISTFMEDRLRFEKIPPEKIDIIYNLMDFSRFSGSKATKNREKRILYIGEYTRPKGAHILLEALKGLGGCNASFYGKGVLKEQLRKNALEWKLNATINDAIPYGEIPKVLNDHDIVVIPSLVGEAFGRAALEACASGKTVVASDIGGIKDIVEEGVTGYTFPPGNVSRLNRLLKKAIAGELKIDPEKIKKNVTAKFSKKKIVSRVLEVYRSLAHGKA
jgi:glycosyltransferase involved in cell wall biosynthesis